MTLTLNRSYRVIRRIDIEMMWALVCSTPAGGGNFSSELWDRAKNTPSAMAGFLLLLVNRMEEQHLPHGRKEHR